MSISQEKFDSLVEDMLATHLNYSKGNRFRSTPSDFYLTPTEVVMAIIEPVSSDDQYFREIFSRKIHDDMLKSVEQDIMGGWLKLISDMGIPQTEELYVAVRAKLYQQA